MYQAISAWGRMFGSHQYYIEDQIERAKQDQAPELAVFWCSDRERWITLEDVGNAETRQWFVVNYPEIAACTNWGLA